MKNVKRITRTKKKSPAKAACVKTKAAFDLEPILGPGLSIKRNEEEKVLTKEERNAKA